MNQLELERDAPDGWFSQYDIAVLYPEIETIPENGLYLEVGVYHGRSLWIATKAAKPSVEIWGTDIIEDPEIPGTHFIQGDSKTVKWDKPVDVLFIDANHDYEYVKSDIDRFVPFVKKGGAVLFHDCDETSPGVVKAVNEYAKANKKTVQLFKSQDFNTSIAKIQL